ncbi:MAG: hypothetical protein ACI4YB_03715 [Oscillospiraceae bacterium]
MINSSNIFISANSPPEQVKSWLDGLIQELGRSNIKIYNQESDSTFRVEFGGNTTISSKIIVLPTKESRFFSKITHSSEKKVDALVVKTDYTCETLLFSDNELNCSGFRKKLIMLKEYGLMPDNDYVRLFDLFMCAAKNGLYSDEEYLEDGLTYDHKYVIYNGKRIETSAPGSMTDEDKASCKEILEAFLSCCTKEKAMLLLMIQLMGLSFEIIKSLPPEKRRKCQPTVLPYIYGDSGCGKTTISRAFFDAYDESRFISLSTSTEAAVQKKLSSEFCGVVVIDDVQHTSIGKCASKTTEKLEAVIRTFGDIGAEKTTALGKLLETSVWAVVTAEAIFTTVHSSILRLLPIEFVRGEISFEHVAFLEKSKDAKDKFFLCYLSWFVSKLSVTNGEISDIADFSEGYYPARNELSDKYKDIHHDRILDNHTLLLSYFSFLAEFFQEIGITDQFLFELKQGIITVLYNSAKIQCSYISEASLSGYIRQAIDRIIFEEKVVPYNIVGSDVSVIRASSTQSDIAAYRFNNILMFTVAQQRAFFGMIRKELPNGSAVKDKDIKKELISMGILLNVKNDKPIFDLNTDNRVRLDNKDTRVIKIKIPKEEIQNE